MFSKLSAAFAAFAIAAQLVVASPPACLIGAVSTQDNPHDVEGVCSGDAAKEVAKAIGANCGSAKDAATKWFASVCKEAGVTISTSSSSSSSSSSDEKSSTKSSSPDSPSSSDAITSPTGTHTNAYPTGTGAYPIGTGASSGFQTYPQAAPTNNGTFVAPNGNAPTTTRSEAPASTGASSRMGVDILGLAAVGIFGAMVAL